MKFDRLTSPYYQGVPEYMIEVYDWAYVNPDWVRRLDHKLVVWVLLFGNTQRLIKAYLDQIEPGSKFWQVAHVYGNQVKKVAAHIGPEGHFDLTDVTPIQVERANTKLVAYPNAHIHRSDAAFFRGGSSYDAIGSFFLLHEVPDDRKRLIVDNILNGLSKNGKAIFIDYHRPALWHPVRQILNLVNTFLEPFARSMWDHGISHFASHADDFIWRKQTFFGGVYQCTTATRR